MVSFVQLLTSQTYWEMREQLWSSDSFLFQNKLSCELGLQLRYKLSCWSCLFNFCSLHCGRDCSLDAPEDTPSRLFSNIPIFSVKSCPNFPGWVLERRKRSSSKLWCCMTDSATDEPLLLPTCAYRAYIYPRGISQDKAVWIIELSCSRGDKANLQFSSCAALEHEEILSAGKDIKILCQTGTYKVGTALVGTAQSINQNVLNWVHINWVIL